MISRSGQLRTWGSPKCWASQTAQQQMHNAVFDLLGMPKTAQPSCRQLWAVVYVFRRFGAFWECA
eukprot:1678355-Alexandrium_andersonii.AAC.1